MYVISLNLGTVIYKLKIINLPHKVTMQITLNDTMFRSMPSKYNVLKKMTKKAGICIYINYAIDHYVFLRGQVLFKNNIYYPFSHYKYILTIEIVDCP